MLQPTNSVIAAVSSLLDALPDAMISVDRAGDVVQFNASAELMFRTSQESMRGRPFVELLPPDLRPGLVRGFNHLVDSRAEGFVGQRIETRARRTDGSEFPIELTLARIDALHPAGFLAYVRDLTGQKAAQRAVQESEHRYREFVENAVFGMFQSTVNGRFLSVNPALVSMLGYASAAEVLSLNLATEVYVDEHVRHRILKNERGRPVEAQWRRKDGTSITVRMTGSTSKLVDGTSCFDVFVEDVTDRRALEVQLAQSQRVETLGRFAGGIAHDFNNILTVIIGYSNSLLTDLPLSREARAEVEQISRAADRAAQLTRQILAFSRKQVLQPVAMDLNRALADMQVMLARIVAENIAVTLDRSIDAAIIHADPGQIEQVVINLAVNARDAMPNGGQLRIATSRVMLDDAFVRSHVGAAAGPHVRLSVSDTGEGMSDAIVGRIFEPFFTTKTIDRGTGLGLSTVYGIVKQSGGSIWVTSELGVGSTFDVYLPAHEKILEAESKPDAGGVKTGTETVLIVEDDQALRTMVASTLQQLGYAVVVAESEEDAIRIAADATLKIDLLFTDVVMPMMNGRQLAGRINLLRPAIPVLYMSGHSDDAIERHGVLDPGTSFVEKPFTRDQLASKLREALELHNR